MNKEKKTCFVIMPFGKSNSIKYKRNLSIYQTMIKFVAEKCGYNTIRSDELKHPGSITRDIIEYLNASDLVIADLSGRNPNVYYELGVRHSIFCSGTIPIILKGEKLPFDIADYRAISYTFEQEDADNFRQDLEERIRAFEKMEKTRPDNPVHQILGSRLFNQNKIEQLVRELENLREEKKLLQIKLNELTTEYSVQNRSLRKLIAEKQHNEKAIRSLNERISGLEKQLFHLKGQNDFKPAELHTKPIENSKVLGMSDDDVYNMLKNHGYYDSRRNNTSRGVQHSYLEKTIRQDKVVFDEATGLMWQQSGSSVYMEIDAIEEWIKLMNEERYADKEDWRLPTVEEAMSLMEAEKSKEELFINPIFDKEQRWIWTSDKVKGAPRAWIVFFDYGYCGYSIQQDYDYYVRAVRFR